VQAIGAVLLLAAFAIAILGYLNQHYNLPLPEPVEYFVADFYANLATDFFSITITVLVINELYERNKMQQVKDQLIRQMGHAGNELALLAVEELRAYGWLEDGSLQKVSLQRASLNRAPLFSANLENTDLAWAELHYADFKWANLHGAVINCANLENSFLIGTNLTGSHLSRVHLKGAFLIDANLQDANLQGADLTCACFWNADLRGAQVTEAQLRKAIMLQGTIMMDGNIYDGRYHIRGDITLSNEKDIVDDTSAILKFSPQAIDREELPGYVRENETHASQYLRWKWASENLAAG
jgi:hypothetical protein